MKLERSDVKYPLWRTKVDSSLFHYRGTTIPNWACDTWHIAEHFSQCTSKRNPKSKVKIVFEKVDYQGWVTCAKEGRVNPAYRLYFPEDLEYRIKEVYLMSFMRDIENRLRKNENKDKDIEDEIAFWEFLDIEFDSSSKTFYFTSYYKQKPMFPELFKRLIGSPVLSKMDDELSGKDTHRIHKQNWKPREALEWELGADNVIYTLIDTKNKLIYIGEADDLKRRLKQTYNSIKNWNYYKYSTLGKEFKKKHRVAIERMLIRDFASLLDNKSNIEYKKISEYKLANDKIDSP